MLFVIIVASLMFLVLGFGIYFISRELKKAEVKFSGNKNKPSESVQDELGFKDIRNGILDLGNHRYRLICEVGAVNYRLQSEQEQIRIEVGFNRFINSLSWPIQIHIQSRKLDNTDLINNQRKVVDRVTDKFPQLKSYAESHLNNLSNLPEFIGTNVIKKNYIVIPYDGAANLAKLNDEEKFSEAARELSNRMNTVIDGLKRVGVKCKPLNSIGIAEILFTTFNRDRIGQDKAILNGDYFTLGVKSIYDYVPPKTTEEQAFDILSGLESIINCEEDLPERLILQDILTSIKALRDKEAPGNDLINESVPA